MTSPSFSVVEVDLLRAGLDQQRHAADHRRAEFGAGDHVALGVGERAGEIEPLVEDRRIGRLHQQDAHLAADRDHRRIEDVHHHRIGRPVRRARRRRARLDRQLRLHDRQADIALVAVASAPTTRRTSREQKSADLPCWSPRDAVAIDQQPAIGALHVFLDVVAVLGEAHGRAPVAQAASMQEMAEAVDSQRLARD